MMADIGGIVQPLDSHDRISREPPLLHEPATEAFHGLQVMVVRAVPKVFLNLKLKHELPNSVRGDVTQHLEFTADHDAAHPSHRQLHVLAGVLTS
ncbi:MAG: hypothetical protein SH850_28370 [Planctomycetaceae bacterium]|nr:hypothetical protein [Planctomycetaceae bacterium]